MPWTPPPGIISAPIAAKLIPKSPIGISIWERVLLDKFLYTQATHSTLQELRHLGAPISQGTITGGLKKISVLFEPLYLSIYQQQMRENLFHNDESRWEVYEPVEGKVGHRWYLWVMKSPTTLYYCIDPTRSAKVVLDHYSELIPDRAIVICDRYSAYKKLARLNESIILAFCWAHVRRDFLDLARSHPHLKNWGFDWVQSIGQIYHLNKLRLALWNSDSSLDAQSVEFLKAHKELSQELDRMKKRYEKLLNEDTKAQAEKQESPEKLDKAQRKVLCSLKVHWDGLRIFIDHPYVAMDNNSAERAIRGPVVGRKTYYGSGSIWSSKLAAMMFSIFQTILLWKLNPHTWTRLYLQSCAENAGQAPDDLSDFLPWLMSEERRHQLSQPLNTPTTMDTS